LRAIRARAGFLRLTKDIQTVGKERRGKKLRYWTPEEDEVLRRLARNELYITEAMEILGRGDGTIRGRLKTLVLFHVTSLDFL
jgi:hypothetical protein